MNNRRSFFARVAAAGLALFCPSRRKASDAIMISCDDVSPVIHGNVFRSGAGDSVYIQGPGKDFAIVKDCAFCGNGVGPIIAKKRTTPRPRRRNRGGGGVNSK